MKRYRFPAFAWWLFIATGQVEAIPESQVVAGSAQSSVDAFVRAIDGLDTFPSQWKDIRHLAAKNGLEGDIPLEVWKSLLVTTGKGSLKSRHAVQLHPMMRKRAYFDLMMHEFGQDSDLFTRWCAFEYMKEFFPDDLKCPKYGLLLLLDSWNEERFPEGITLHGELPRDVALLSIGSQWHLVVGTLTPERIARLLVESNKWRFDRKTSTWRHAENPTWLPRVPD